MFRKEEPIVIKNALVYKREIKEDGNEVSEEDEEKKKQIEDRNAELLREEIKKRNKKKKLEAPLYVTMYDIHKFRLAKFFMMLLSFTFTFSTYYFLTHRSFVNVTQQSHMKKVFDAVVLYNPLYKNALQKQTLFMSKMVNDLIVTKRDFLVLSNLLNNLIFNPGISKEDEMRGIDAYNAYFLKVTSIYEVFYSMRMVGKAAKEDRKIVDTNSLFLKPEVLDFLYITKEYTTSKSDDSERRLVHRNRDFLEIMKVSF